MPATIHSLFPAPDPAQPPHPLLVELRSRALALLEARVRTMFDSADDLLFEYSERAANDVERRRYFDTMRVVRLERARIAETYATRIGDGFRATAASAPAQAEDFDLEHLSIQSTEALEEKIALSNMATRAEGHFRTPLWELERRLEQARAGGIAIAADCLHPAQLSQAFGTATAALDTDFQIKLILYKLFDRAVMQALGPLYETALQLLEQHGFRGNGGVSRPAAPAAGAARVQAGGAAPSGGGVSTATADPSLDLLRRYGLDPQQLAASAQPQAAELGAALQTLLGLPNLHAVQASSQRLAMASRLFDELLAEPLLPQPLRPALESLRYPAYYAALTDAGFFDDARHPLRLALHELVERILAAQTGDTAPTDFQPLIERLGTQLAPSRGFGFTTLATAAQLPAVEVERFSEQLRTQARSRREALLARVRGQVTRDLESHALGRADLPAPVQSLLRAGFGPLLGVRMLRQGRSSEAFRAAEDLLDRLLGSLDARPPEAAAQRTALVGDLRQAFADIGMKPERMQPLLDGLQQVYDGAVTPETTDTPADPSAEAAPPVSAAEADALLIAPFETRTASTAPSTEAPSVAAPPTAPTAPASELPSVTVMELLRRVLTPESWFRVYDAAHEQTRWLKLSSFYADQDSITFTGFDEGNRLALHASRFAEDLALGHSEPVNPSNQARTALEQLRHAKSRGLF